MAEEEIEFDWAWYRRPCFHGHQTTRGCDACLMIHRGLLSVLGPQVRPRRRSPWISDWARADERREVVLPSQEEVDPLEIRLEALLEDPEGQRFFERMADRLTAHGRRLNHTQLYYVERELARGRTTKELAAELGRDVATMRKVRLRARKRSRGKVSTECPSRDLST